MVYDELVSTRLCYIRYYRSPEIALCYGEKSSALDIWALGASLLEIYKYVLAMLDVARESQRMYNEL